MEAPPPPPRSHGQGRPPPPPDAAPPPRGAGPAAATADHGGFNGAVLAREPFLVSPAPGDLPGPVSAVPNGSQLGPSLKPTAKGGMLVKAGLKTFSLRSGLDRKAERCPESRRQQGHSRESAETRPVPNGIAADAAPESLANGCLGKGADNDGSGSESGYTTPKKRKGRRNSVKGCDNPGQEKTAPRSPAIPASKLEPEPLKADGEDLKASSRLEGPKPAWKCEPPLAGLGLGRGKPGEVGDMLRKAAEAKVGPAGKKLEERPKGKHVLISKDDPWTLFKPPPVFPVDNSSAKIVPKISYASKVKENLNKAAQNSALSHSSSSSSSSLCSSSAGEGHAQPASRLSQVPMSAMKSVTSAGFSNGPLLSGADHGACPAGVQALLVPAASAVLSASSKLAAPDAVASMVATDPQKPSLFVYPSDAHGLFGVADQAEPPFQATQQNLGDIFQNQWGLSFINEPSAGPEASVREPADTTGAAKVTFQGSGPATFVQTPAAGPEPPAFPKAYELAKRTSPQRLGALLELGAAGEESGLLSEPPQAEPGVPGPLVFLAKDYRAVESALSSPTNTLLVSTKEPRQPGGREGEASWGEFDLRAAVVYHVQEMESLRHLQKRDPKRIVTYAEALETPGT